MKRPTSCPHHAMELANQAAARGDVAMASDLYALVGELVAEQQAKRKWARGKAR